MKPSTAGWLFAAPALTVIGLFFGLPVIAALALSLTDFDIYALADIGNLRFVGLDNYIGLLQNPLFWKSLGNTLYFVIVGVPLSVVMSLGAALLLHSRLGKLKPFFRSVLRASGDHGGRGGGDLALPVPYQIRLGELAAVVRGH